MSEQPEYITIQLRRPSDSYPDGVVEEGWFVVKDNVVFLSDRNGTRCRQGQQTSYRAGRTAREVAVRLLRWKARSDRQPLQSAAAVWANWLVLGVDFLSAKPAV